MTKDNFFLLTGPPGGGKSALLNHLHAQGFVVVAEPARQILAEQRRIDGVGVPSRDPRLFVELMLSRAISDYMRRETTAAPVFFDRGIPDVVGYATLFGFDHPPGRNAAQEFRYNRRVFFVPAWEAIYTTDDERTVPFAVASQFGDDLRAAYLLSGYDLIEMPCVSVEERAEFLRSHL
jgi:predicted ATPase